MTYSLNPEQCFDIEHGVHIVHLKNLSKMVGQIEYAVKVHNTNTSERFLRLVCKAECDGSKFLIDTITGSIYLKKQCRSGPLIVVGNPSATGRLVPTWERRGIEAVARALVNEHGCV